MKNPQYKAFLKAKDDHILACERRIAELEAKLADRDELLLQLYRVGDLLAEFDTAALAEAISPDFGCKLWQAKEKT